MTVTVLIIAAGLAVGLAASWRSDRHPVFALWWYGALTVMSCVLFIQALLSGNGLETGWWAFCIVLNSLIWWTHWRRRKRRKAAALIGAKSRALRDALVRKVRESAKPRPVLKPAPGGVHA